jgi:hypothetical protein
VRSCVIAILLGLLASSCSVQERHYRKGLTIRWRSQGKHVAKQSSCKEQTALQALVPRTMTEGEVQRQGPEASANGAPAFHFNRKSSAPVSAPDSCDEIFLRSGEKIRAKVVEIDRSLVKYKKCDLPGGPLYSTYRSGVTVIIYANGSHETFTVTAPVPEEVHSGKGKTQRYDDPAAVKKDAVISFLLGLLGFVIVYYGSVHAIVLGRRVLRIMNANPGKYEGRGFAVAGLVLGILKLALLMLFILASTDLLGYLI